MTGRSLQSYDQWLDESAQDAFESQVEGVVQQLYFDEGCVHGAEQDECRICNHSVLTNFGDTIASTDSNLKPENI